MDKSRFDVVLLGIDKQGQWHINDANNYLQNASDPARIALNPSESSVALVPGQPSQQLMNATDANPSAIDVIFPIVHGTQGEDGSLQGCCAWQTCRSSAPMCWAPPPVWTKT
jgi:D-alanine-D-alanine ligase